MAPVWSAPEGKRNAWTAICDLLYVYPGKACLLVKTKWGSVSFLWLLCRDPRKPPQTVRVESNGSMVRKEVMGNRFWAIFIAKLQFE
jgi:hypothetical protein